MEDKDRKELEEIVAKTKDEMFAIFIQNNCNEEQAGAYIDSAFSFLKDGATKLKKQDLLDYFEKELPKAKEEFLASYKELISKK